MNLSCFLCFLVSILRNRPQPLEYTFLVVPDAVRVMKWVWRACSPHAPLPLCTGASSFQCPVESLQLDDGTAKGDQSSLSVQLSSVAQSCPTLCNPMNCSTPGLSVHHQLPEFTQTHVHQVGDAIQPSHLLSSFSPPALNPSQHQGLFQ